jgi:signal transduction histidine kinase
VSGATTPTPARRPWQRALLGAIGVVVLALLVSEVTMRPSTAERVQLLAIFGVVALLVVVAAALLGRWTTRLSSLHGAMVLTAIGAVAAAATAIVASASAMFISAHDLRLVLVALGLGVALGIVLASTVARPLEADLRAIGATAERVAAGDRDVRTGVTRADEVGALAAALDEMVDRLAAAEDERARMEQARRAFLAAVGHDLRTPLTSLRGAIEAIEDGMVDDPTRYLAAMRADVALLGSLVDDLFLLSRIESGALDLAPEDADLAELADEAVEVAALAGRARGRAVAVALDAAGTVPVRVAPRELGRVLRNLLDNAVRHAPEHTTVMLEVGVDGPDAVVHVRDEGTGFPADLLDRAFESFVRADEARTRDGAGAGLGLAIARGLVEAHGGRVRAHPGPGGHVEVRLPLRRVTAPAT